MNNDIDLFEEFDDPEPAARSIRTKPPEAKFSKVYFIRCTPAEAEQIDAIAANFDMSVSRLFVAKFLNDKDVLNNEEKKIFGDILQHLSKIGTNLNQTAAALNSARLSNETIKLSQKYLFDLRTEIQNVVSEFKRETRRLWRF
jgi:cell division protein ZapA (FtsZ GTPase activity inhibitor)